MAWLDLPGSMSGAIPNWFLGFFWVTKSMGTTGLLGCLLPRSFALSCERGSVAR
jgi:hypothetical protein